MKKVLTNPVLKCETYEEFLTAKTVLTKKNYEFEEFEEAYEFEVYHTLSISAWLNLIDEITNLIN